MTLEATIEHRALTSGDLQQIVAIEEASLDCPTLCLKSEIADIEKSCSSGCSPAILVNGEIIAYTLCYHNEYGVAFVDKCYVKPKYRGHGHQKHQLQVCQLELLKVGVKTAYAMCSPFNVHSLRNFEDVGFTKSHDTVCNGQKRIVLRYEVGNR